MFDTKIIPGPVEDTQTMSIETEDAVPSKPKPRKPRRTKYADLFEQMLATDQKLKVEVKKVPTVRQSLITFLKQKNMLDDFKVKTRTKFEDGMARVWIEECNQMTEATEQAA